MVKYSSQSDNESYDPTRQSLEKTKSLKLKKKNNSKNAIKNICMPMVDFLIKNNLQHVLKELNIIRSQIQRINSASAQIFYKILTHQDVKCINKHNLFQSINAKIACSSKITKKPFHLQVVQQLQRVCQKQQFPQFKQFKSSLTKIKKKVQKKIKKIDPIFQKRSLTQYVLILFYNHFLNDPNQTAHQQLFAQRTTKILNNQNQILYQNLTLQNTKSEKIQSRNKDLIKKIVILFNQKTYDKNNIQIQQNNLSDMLNCQFLKLKKKNYRLFDTNILQEFHRLVVKNCTKLLQQGKKLTYVCLDKLVKDYCSAIFSKTMQKQTQQIELQQTQQNRNLAKKQKTFIPMILFQAKQNI